VKREAKRVEFDTKERTELVKTIEVARRAKETLELERGEEVVFVLVLALDGDAALVQVRRTSSARALTGGHRGGGVGRTRGHRAVLRRAPERVRLVAALNCPMAGDVAVKAAVRRCAPPMRVRSSTVIEAIVGFPMDRQARVPVPGKPVIGDVQVLPVGAPVSVGLQVR
jgi:hypothetical protein